MSLHFGALPLHWGRVYLDWPRCFAFLLVTVPPSFGKGWTRFHAVWFVVFTVPPALSWRADLLNGLQETMPSYSLLRTAIRHTNAKLRGCYFTLFPGKGP